MKWTKETPTRPGAYWWRQKPNQCGFLVKRFKDGSYRMAGIGIVYNDGMMESGEWCGPLLPSEEVEKAYHEGVGDAHTNVHGLKVHRYNNSHARRVVEGEEV